MDFEQVLKEVLWRLVTEGSVSYRRIKRGFNLDDEILEDVRREMISTLRIAADVDGELLVWTPDGRAARPEPMALPQPLPALRHGEKPTGPSVERDLNPVLPDRSVRPSGKTQASAYGEYAPDCVSKFRYLNGFAQDCRAGDSVNRRCICITAREHDRQTRPKAPGGLG